MRVMISYNDPALDGYSAEDAAELVETMAREGVLADRLRNAVVEVKVAEPE